MGFKSPMPFKLDKSSKSVNVSPIKNTEMGDKREQF